MNTTVFERLCAHTRETTLLESAKELLEWDERTYLPPAAGDYRAEQITYLSGLIHARQTDPRVGDWLSELQGSPLADDPHSDAGATIRELRRQYDRRIRVPQRLVEDLARASVLGQQSWVKARQADQFDGFVPQLETILRLKREEAAALGIGECPYDALLDEFEPGASTGDVTTILDGLREELVPLVAEITHSRRAPSTDVLRRRFPVAAQEAFGRSAAQAIGFDFRRGRLDVTHHPFCAGMGPHDCRITTRYDERFFPSAFFGILHEAGHGIYEQGQRAEQYGLPPGSYVSLGIHESQSRLWENLVGRSRGFWEHFLPLAQEAFPAALGSVSLDEFYQAINHVEPSLIRVEADEATYNLHIIVRFELEQALVNDTLAISDLPQAWRDKYQKYLGIEPQNDAGGVLQDVHWSAGLIGYFPTYSLGNLYAAQLFEAAARELDSLEAMFANGDFAPLGDWLRAQIHEPGQRYSASQLVKKVTGQALSHRPLLDHLHGKLRPIYGI
jgi:carboxypeptidase Taq